jgi:hypothetical protein
MLNMSGDSATTSYKQYAEVAEHDAVIFNDFNVDPDFSDCLPGLSLLMLKSLKSGNAKLT